MASPTIGHPTAPLDVLFGVPTIDHPTVPLDVLSYPKTGDNFLPGGLGESVRLYTKHKQSLHATCADVLPSGRKTWWAILFGLGGGGSHVNTNIPYKAALLLLGSVVGKAFFKRSWPSSNFVLADSFKMETPFASKITRGVGKMITLLQIAW